MKKIIYALSIGLFVLVSGCTKPVDNTALCNNGKLDGNETEIDCGGGSCNACPPAATFSAKFNGVWYNATNVYWTQSGPSYSVRASNPTAAISAGLFFSTPVINQAEPLNSASVDDNNFYIIEPGNSGTVTVTAIDTLHKIMSGTFSFTATAPPNNPIAVDSGSFTNVRIQQVQ